MLGVPTFICPTNSGRETLEVYLRQKVLETGNVYSVQCLHLCMRVNFCVSLRLYMRIPSRAINRMPFNILHHPLLLSNFQTSKKKKKRKKNAIPKENILSVLSLKYSWNTPCTLLCLLYHYIPPMLFNISHHSLLHSFFPCYKKEKERCTERENS